jgi:hypothetical protein
LERDPTVAPNAEAPTLASQTLTCLTHEVFGCLKAADSNINIETAANHILVFFLLF